VLTIKDNFLFEVEKLEELIRPENEPSFKLELHSKLKTKKRSS
jgi:hypothetical protein